jgi:bifunctional NMN adenylyltransferase/nudix hydrolase
MQEVLPKYDFGVIVARFQVHELHPAQRDLIEHVRQNHDKVVILLGLSPLPTTLNNPLDFEARKQMILADFPDVNVLYIRDQFDDEVWSRKLDEIVNDIGLPGQSVVLYGGRDSFLPHYKGQFPTRELKDTEDRFLSGTAVRRAIGKAATKGSPDFRAGVIWASQARFPTAYQCVDIAILNEDGTKVLLGRKPNEKKFRFIGGFSDPRSLSLEEDARREVMEEAGVDITDPEYVGSTRVDDWRYRNEPDCIKTALFKCKYRSGRPQPGDDIEEVRWFTLPAPDSLVVKSNPPAHYIGYHTINPGHRTLLQMLVRNLKGDTHE